MLESEAQGAAELISAPEFCLPHVANNPSNTDLSLGTQY